MRFCKDCKYIDFNPFISKYQVCLHEKSGGWNLVTGEREPYHCKYMREDERFCGKEGKLFEKKEGE